MGGVTSGKPVAGAPEPLTVRHDLSAFRSGEPALDDWLRHRAQKSQQSGAARTYVVASEHRVVGYYSLAVGAVGRAEVPGRVRRKMAEPVPVMLLARLAIEQSRQGRGLGRGLLKDAVLRTLQAADIAGIRAMLVHAISDDAKRFYQYFGFQASETKEMTLAAKLTDLQNALP